MLLLSKHLLKFKFYNVEVFINNQSVSISGASTLFKILAQHNFLEKKGIAVAVNNSVVTKAQWDGYAIAMGDKITIIRATQGG